MGKQQRKKERIKSIDKALDLLEFLSSNEHELGILKISKELNMGLSTVHRILTTLRFRGYVIQNQKTAKYRLGIKLFELRTEVQSAKILIKTTRPYLRELSELTNETSNLAILEGKEVIYLDTIESSEILRTGIREGTRILAHCTALGKVMLAFLPEHELNQLYQTDEPIISLTSRSILSVEQLKEELKTVKAQGYAIDKEEYKTGINCVSVPVFIRNEEVLAAISITGPATRLTINKMEDAKHVLIKISNQISKELLM